MAELPTVARVVQEKAVRSVFQPIVDLDTGAVLAYEALARGPVGPLERPDLLFAAARREGLLRPLDALCRNTAIRTAASMQWPSDVGLFVNVEPEVLDLEPWEELIRLAHAGPHGLRVVLEITERAISARPAELLACVRRLRRAGWLIALDDVGADDLSLAFMPLLRPDVIKLDLALVHERPGPDVARIMNAVNAYSSQTGSVILAEGIEHQRHLAAAQALGATLGQGWLFGRPDAALHPSLPTAPLRIGAAAPPVHLDEGTSVGSSPFGCLPPETRLRRSTKPLLVEISKYLEQEALERGRTCVTVSTFQFARHFTPETQRRYSHLADRLGFVAAIGEGLTPEPAPGVRGANITSFDALRDEWDLVVLAPHFSAALLARDLNDDGPDEQRRFEFALTYDRDVAAAAAEALLSRVVPSEEAIPVPSTHVGDLVGCGDSSMYGSTPSRARLGRDVGASATVRTPGSSGSDYGSFSAESVTSPTILRRALDATTTGVTIADMTQPDHPLVFVNAAFERLAGVNAQDSLGRNCNFLQGPGTDPVAVAAIRRAIAAGRKHRVTLLNYRRDHDEPWWNEVYLAPVRDESGAVVQYVGIQNDVTQRVRDHLELEAERARSRTYLAEMETLAYGDPLTGLRNRRRLPDLVEQAIEKARGKHQALAFLYVDVDEFKAINDEFGHHVGDQVLQRVAGRIDAMDGAITARIGGDEFVLVVAGLVPERAHADAQVLAVKVANLVHADGSAHRARVSVGVSIYPADGDDFDSLMRVADDRMYQSKNLAKSPLTIGSAWPSA